MGVSVVTNQAHNIHTVLGGQKMKKKRSKYKEGHAQKGKVPPEGVGGRVVYGVFCGGQDSQTRYRNTAIFTDWKKLEKNTVYQRRIYSNILRILQYIYKAQYH